MDEKFDKPAFTLAEALELAAKFEGHLDDEFLDRLVATVEWLEMYKREALESRKRFERIDLVMKGY
jgi:hypothetical protein